jgi:hypothetical protein
VALGSVLSRISSLVHQTEYHGRATRMGPDFLFCGDFGREAGIPSFRGTSDNMRAHVRSPRRELQVPPATIFVRRGSPTAHFADQSVNTNTISPLVRRSVCTRCVIRNGGAALFRNKI